MKEDPRGDVPRRIIPALPDSDPVMGAIRWDRWEKALNLTICLRGGSQADMDCETCAFPGPLRTTQGKTFYTPESTLERVARSTQTKDGRSRWKRVQREPYWCYTHWAQFCPACDEMFAWRRIGPDGGQEWTEILYHPYTVAKKAPPEEGMLF